MKHLFVHIIILVTVLVFPLSAMQVDIPNELPAYENLAVSLTPSEGEGPVMAARLYFFQEGKETRSMQSSLKRTESGLRPCRIHICRVKNLSITRSYRTRAAPSSVNPGSGQQKPGCCRMRLLRS